jgi:hypothetical protein
MTSRGVVKFGLFQDLVDLSAEGGVTRHIVARVMMHREAVIELGEWLVKNARTLELDVVSEQVVVQVFAWSQMIGAWRARLAWGRSWL